MHECEVMCVHQLPGCAVFRELGVSQEKVPDGLEDSRLSDCTFQPWVWDQVYFLCEIHINM